ncbi:recombinase family protein [Bradyrhizobium sp. 160]|uniref:recombinase family protein n=1 Tax=Bradyrhizobium sp. 160 TaxID=2782634 RepID=UPI001FFA78B7|nr:recombinase family protein [Bradyrhizobium sp. 160]
MSEMELSIFRQRSLEDPDRRIQEALALVFTKFAEMQTLRQVHLWLRQERITLPAVGHGPEGRHVEWKLPVYNTIYHILTNPAYAGAYVFGRSGSRVTIEAGRKRIVRGFRRERNDWEVLIKDHHDGYITWAQFERNQRLITDNANGKSFMSRGSVRRGEGLLAGLLRCGHCGRKLHVAYSGTHSTVGRYHCRGRQTNHGGVPCISSVVCARTARSARRSSRGCSRWVYRRRWRP